MRYPAGKGKPDSNHDQVVAWYEQLGCSVHDTHMVGGGFPDIAVGSVGITDLVEIKTLDGVVKPNQVTFRDAWRGGRPRLIATHADVVAHVQELRRRARGS